MLLFIGRLKNVRVILFRRVPVQKLGVFIKLVLIVFIRVTSRRVILFMVLGETRGQTRLVRSLTLSDRNRRILLLECKPRFRSCHLRGPRCHRGHRAVVRNPSNSGIYSGSYGGRSNSGWLTEGAYCGPQVSE